MERILKELFKGKTLFTLFLTFSNFDFSNFEIYYYFYLLPMIINILLLYSDIS